MAELSISILCLNQRGWFESVNRADGCFCSVFWRVERFSSVLVYVEFSQLMSPGELDVEGDINIRVCWTALVQCLMSASIENISLLSDAKITAARVFHEQSSRL